MLNRLLGHAVLKEGQLSAQQEICNWLEQPANEKRIRFTDYSTGESFKVVDVRVARAADEDAEYSKDLDLRAYLRRGCAFLTSYDLEGQTNHFILRQGLPKFFDYIYPNGSDLNAVQKFSRQHMEDDIQTIIEKIEAHEKEDQMSDPIDYRLRDAPSPASKIIQIRVGEKLNGENAQISYCEDLRLWVCCSKNVTMLSDQYGTQIDNHIETKRDPKKQSSRMVIRRASGRYTTALRVLATWLAMLHPLNDQQISKLKTLLSHGSLIGELTGTAADASRVVSTVHAETDERSGQSRQDFFISRFGESSAAEAQSLLDGKLTFFAFVDHHALLSSLATALTHDNPITTCLHECSISTAPYREKYSYDLSKAQDLDITLADISRQIFVSEGTEGVVVYVSLKMTEHFPGTQATPSVAPPPIPPPLCFQIWKMKSFEYLASRRIRERLKNVPRKVAIGTSGVMSGIWDCLGFHNQELEAYRHDVKNIVRHHSYSPSDPIAVDTEKPIAKFTEVLKLFVIFCQMQPLEDPEICGLVADFVDTNFQLWLTCPSLDDLQKAFSDQYPSVRVKYSTWGKVQGAQKDSLTFQWQSFDKISKARRKLHLVSPCLAGLSLQTLRTLSQSCQLELIKCLLDANGRKLIPSLGCKYRVGRKVLKCDASQPFSLNANPYLVEKMLCAAHDLQSIDSLSLWTDKKASVTTPVNRIIILDYDFDLSMSRRMTSPILEFASSLDSSSADDFASQVSQDQNMSDTKVIGTLESEKRKKRRLNSNSQSDSSMATSVGQQSIHLKAESVRGTEAETEDNDSACSEDGRQKHQWLTRMRYLKAHIAAQVLCSNEDVSITQSLCVQGCCCLFGVERHKPKVRFENLIEVCYKADLETQDAAETSTTAQSTPLVIVKTSETSEANVASPSNSSARPASPTVAQKPSESPEPEKPTTGDVSPIWTSQANSSSCSKAMLILSMGFPGCGKSTLLSRFCDMIITSCEPETRRVDGSYFSFSASDVPTTIQLGDPDKPVEGVIKVKTVGDAHVPLNFWHVPTSIFVALLPSDDLIRQNLASMDLPREKDAAFKSASQYARRRMDEAIEKSVSKALARQFRHIYILVDKNMVPDAVSGACSQWQFIMDSLRRDSSIPPFLYTSLLLTTAYDVCTSFQVSVPTRCPSCALSQDQGCDIGSKCWAPMDEAERRLLSTKALTPDDVLTYEQIEVRFRDDLDDAITYSGGEWILPWSVRTLVEASLRCFSRRDHPTLEAAQVLNVLLSFVCLNRRCHQIAPWKRGSKPHDMNSNMMSSESSESAMHVVDHYGIDNWRSQGQGLKGLYRQNHLKSKSDSYNSYDSKCFAQHTLELPLMQSTWQACVENAAPDSTQFQPQFRCLGQLIRQAVLKPFKPFTTNYQNAHLYRTYETVLASLLQALTGVPEIRLEKSRKSETSIATCLTLLSAKLRSMEQVLDSKASKRLAAPKAVRTLSSAGSSARTDPIYIGIRLNRDHQDYWNVTGLRWIRAVLVQSINRTWKENPKVKGLLTFVDSTPKRCLPALHITTKYFGACVSLMEVRARDEIMKIVQFALNQDYTFDLTHIIICPAGMVVAAVRPRVPLGYSQGCLPWFFEDVRVSAYPHVTLACDRTAGFQPAMATTLLSSVNERLQKLPGRRRTICCLSANSPYALLDDPNLVSKVNGPGGPSYLTVSLQDSAVVSEILFFPLVGNQFSNVFVIHIKEHKLCVAGRYKAFYPT
eukprot:Blabericola_migrator_1__10565@NODE_5_length_29060_cov_171_088642_g4_i0_p1_GENE_NODE_5_length_29060_cov_171_088642_g4_i0NODE_5_length_29060_cov_171_088642_g4_i0_p1_ORF_typecomplete_len1727_score260_76Viral_helicase1/PF01443_18/4_2e02Viral_helicase1/PF01443_18/2_1e02Viral_helicase1/PF01443_18/0_12NACHT/PF05729_12/0_03NACHT/PF05729_12/4e03AAA_16/PF13191_6/0_029AAA_16/PF13191_6/6_2e03AAA_33/PF13671_6/1_8e04AAA_33/PF13671_6/0_12AAA_22/PF13401_6/0_56AAA_22/PF13401_6/2_1e03Zeta_toxin/PF06414_12/0_29Zet